MVGSLVVEEDHNKLVVILNHMVMVETDSMVVEVVDVVIIQPLILLDKPILVVAVVQEVIVILVQVVDLVL